jgi:hypothetical protein
MATATATVPIPPPAMGPGEATIRRTLDLGRSLALLIALIAGVFFLILLALSIFQVVFGGGAGGFVSAAYCLLSAVVNYLLWREFPTFETFAAQRQYIALRDRLLLWVVLGFVFFVVEGIVLAVVWVKVEAVLHPEGTVARAIGPPAPATPSGPAAPLCPRCGQPTTFAVDAQRFYCPRCAQFV